MVHVRLARLLAVGCLLAALAPTPADASGIGTTRMSVDFTKPEDARAKARWEHMEALQTGAKGLGQPGHPRADGMDPVYDASVEVIERMGLGTSWRPPDNAMVRVKATWSGSYAARTVGHLFVRYGCDAASWTDWMPVSEVHAGEPGPVKEYRIDLKVPRAQRAWYAQKLDEYGRTDVPWKSDEEAFVAQLPEAQPAALRAQPFVGYLQFLYDTSFHGGTHLVRLDVEATWVLPGPAYPPSDPKLQQGRDGPWRFRADYGHEDPRAQEEDRWRKEVYEAVLKRAMQFASQLGYGMKEPFQRLVVDSTTAGYGALLMPMSVAFLDRMQQLFPGGSRWDLLASYDEELRRTRWLPADLDLGVPVVLLSYQRYWVFQKRTGDQQWHEFERRWPHSGGLFSVTGIGFDLPKEGNAQAVVHVSRSYGFLAAYGTLYFLERKDGAWTITSEVPTWMS